MGDPVGPPRRDADGPASASFHETLVESSLVVALATGLLYAIGFAHANGAFRTLGVPHGVILPPPFYLRSALEFLFPLATVGAASYLLAAGWTRTRPFASNVAALTLLAFAALPLWLWGARGLLSALGAGGVVPALEYLAVPALHVAAAAAVARLFWRGVPLAACAGRHWASAGWGRQVVYAVGAFLAVSVLAYAFGAASATVLAVSDGGRQVADLDFAEGSPLEGTRLMPLFEHDGMLYLLEPGENASTPPRVHLVPKEALRHVEVVGEAPLPQVT